MSWKPLDIEDIHKVAEIHHFCPYYVSKDRAGAADVIFMPYNYVIDPKIRDSMKIEWQNSIIIFDDAYNLASATEDLASFEIRTS